MNPLLFLFGLDIGLLALAYWAGSLLGLLLVMGLCFAIALGLILFSTAAPEPEIVGKGLEFVQTALDTLRKGVSAKKLVVEV